MLSTRNPLYIQKYRLEVKGQRQIYHANTNKKKAGITTLISDRLQNKENYHKEEY